MSEIYFPSAPLICVEPLIKPADACVIWLHGLGADGHDFEGVLPQLNLPEAAAIRFIFPTAATQAVTVNLGQPMPAWYDIYHPDLLNDADWSGIDASVQYIQGLVAEQMSLGIASERICLAGFSQGGVIALYAALSLDTPLAGVMALSTYFPLTETGQPGVHIQQSNDIPIFYGHGTVDTVCPLAFAEISKQRLMTIGFKVEWHCYSMAHQVCSEEIRDISLFLQRQLC